MIKLVKKLIGLIISPLKALFDFPAVPEGLAAVISKSIEYFDSAVQIIGFFFPLQLAYSLLTVVIAIEVIEHSYYLIMWVVSKIPFLGVK